MEISNLEEFGSEFDEIYRENANDKQFYGQKHNIYNPEVHLDCFVQGVRSFTELREALELLDSHVEYLIGQGWELAYPIEDGLITTEYRGQGTPPLEDSCFDEQGYDLDGNHIDDWNEE